MIGQTNTPTRAFETIISGILAAKADRVVERVAVTFVVTPYALASAVAAVVALIVVAVAP